MSRSVEEIEAAQKEMRKVADKIREKMDIREGAAIVGWAFDFIQNLQMHVKPEEIKDLYWANVEIYMSGKLPDFSAFRPAQALGERS